MVDVPNHFTDRGHWQVAGATGSKDGHGGKTVLCNALAQVGVARGWFGQSLFYDLKADDTVGGVKCRSLEELRRAYDGGERVLRFVPSSPTGEEEIEDVYHGFIARVPGPSLAIWDEAHDYDDSDALNHAVRRGGNEHDCKSVCASQRPTDMSTGVRSQLLTFVWVGPATADLRAHCQRNPDATRLEDGRSIADVVEERHREPFVWSVFDSGVAHTYRPVPSKFA